MKVKIRPVNDGDFWLLFAWRHDKQTEHWSLEEAPTIEQHEGWMLQGEVLQDTFVAEAEGGPVALLQVNPDHLVSINVNPQTRNKGYGVACLQALQERYKDLSAHVIVGNTAGLRLFTKCGFRIIDARTIKHRACVVLEWRKE